MKDTRCYIGDQIRMYKEELARANPKQLVDFCEGAYLNLLKAQDMIQCCNRYVWKNLEAVTALSTQQLEAMLYQNGAICCFLEDETLVFSLFTEENGLNVYGELSSIQPITLDGRTRGKRKRVMNKLGDYTLSDDVAIIIQDYTGSVQKGVIIPRMNHNTLTTISDQVKTYKLLLYNIILSVKKLIAKCENEEQSKVIMKQAELLLDPTHPIVGITTGKDIAQQFELMNYVDKVNIDEFIAIIDFYYKIRRGFNGVPSPDVFEKKERLISSETESAQVHVNITLLDGLKQREYACDMINEFFGTSLSVRLSDALRGGIADDSRGSDTNTGKQSVEQVQ